MKTIRENLASFLLTLCTFAIVAVFYGQMPDPIPTHFGLDGEANGWMPKPWGALVLPLLTAGIFAMMLGLRKISPKGYEVDSFARSLRSLTLAIVAFLFVMTVVITLSSVGVAIDMNIAVALAVGALITVIGNLMGKLTKNFFIGIRTPWTLSSDEVWLRTHRLAGKLFVIAGLVTMAGAFTGYGAYVLLASLLLASAAAIAASYVIYRRLEGFGPRAKGA